MKNYQEFIRHLDCQDNGVDLVDSFHEKVKFMGGELARNKEVWAAGVCYTDKDWIDEFFESDLATAVYRYLARLANTPYDLHPTAATAGQVMDDFRDKWLCELAALDAQYDHEGH